MTHRAIDRDGWHHDGQSGAVRQSRLQHGIDDVEPATGARHQGTDRTQKVILVLESPIRRQNPSVTLDEDLAWEVRGGE